jgi:hypothetical protein
LSDISPQEAAVLRLALALGTFTVRELSVESGVSYAAVQQALESENNVTVRTTADTTAVGTARASRVWEIMDAAALEARLGAALDLPAPDQPPENEATLARMLAAAEDCLIMALRSHVIEDAAAFARQALTHLDGTEVERLSRAEPEDESAPLVKKRNLPPLDGRAWIVGAIAAYLTSYESSGLSGPLWRHAVRTLAAVDLPDQGVLQKGLLVELVRVVDERADGTLLVDSLARAAEDGGALRRFVEQQGDSASEALRGALATLLRQKAQRMLGDETTSRLCELAGELFSSGIAVREDIGEQLVAGLRRLAFVPDGEIARPAQAALRSIGQPPEVAFWRNLAQAQHPPSLALIIEGLGRFDLDAAFGFVQEVIADDSRLAEVQEALETALPALAGPAPHVVDERFTAFVAELPREQRSQLIAVPARAGLEWTLPVERPLAQRLFGLVVRWRTMLDGHHADALVTRQMAKLGDEIVELSRETLFSLGAGEQRLVRDLLTDQLADPAGAAVGVRSLLAVGGESDVARALLHHSPDNTAESIGRWYLHTLPREGLNIEERKALLTAIFVAFRRDEEFLSGLASRAAEIGDDLPELFDNADIDIVVRGKLMEANYRARPNEDRVWLNEYVAHGVRE